jgi:hypothetical protein
MRSSRHWVWLLLLGFAVYIFVVEAKDPQFKRFLGKFVVIR